MATRNLPEARSKLQVSPGLVTIVIAVLVAFVSWLIFRSPSDAYALCARLIPGDNKVGLVIKVPESGPPHIDFGASTSVDKTVVEAIDKIAMCVRNATPDKVGPLLGRLTRTEREPLGQLGDRWSREDGIKVQLATSPNNPKAAKTLNNLSIGPSNGEVTKVSLIEGWCKANAACVTCEPAPLESTAAAVLVRLNERPPVAEEVYQAIAGAPKQGDTYEPWEYVDAQRRRLIYKCGS